MSRDAVKACLSSKRVGKLFGRAVFSSTRDPFDQRSACVAASYQDQDSEIDLDCIPSRTHRPRHVRRARLMDKSFSACDFTCGSARLLLGGVFMENIVQQSGAARSFG